MKKITKLQKIGMVTIGILVILSIAYFVNQKIASAQTSPNIPPIPTVKGVASPGFISLAWTLPSKSTYGFKIERKNLILDNRKIIALFNPKPTGYDLITGGGMYTDETNVYRGNTYVYFITTFDRQGNQSPATSITILAK